VITYTYDDSQNLARVDYPDTTEKLYHYENPSYPNHLTGISYRDTSGTITRSSSYVYDAQGKASRTEYAQTDNGTPQERLTFTYASETRTEITDSISTKEIMRFEVNLGVRNLVAKVNQTDAKTLAQKFDGNNNLICRRDEEGRVTTYAYNATNQRTARTEGLTGSCDSPTAIAGVTRSTTYQYLFPTRDLPTVISAASVAAGQNRRTIIQYSDTANPSLPTIITQNGFTPDGSTISRTVALGYNSAGQLKSVDGPRTDVADILTLEYYECTHGADCGQLKKVANALGHVTTYDLYDAAGRVTQVTDPNGLITNFSYDSRGRVRFVTQTPPAGAARVTE